MANKGWRQACADDPHLKAGLNIHAGKLTYRAVGEALGLPYVWASVYRTQAQVSVFWNAPPAPFSGTDLRDLRRGRWVVQGELDLHGLTRDEARSSLAHFIALSLQQGRRCLRVIHGKGHGSPGRLPVLKHLSRGWLAQREDILAFCQARPHDGGEGALLVLLQAASAARP